MKVLFWYCQRFAWTPTIKTLDQVPDSGPEEVKDTVVAFVHVEPRDLAPGSSSLTKLLKNAKWLARKWEVSEILLHSFTHLAQEKAGPDQAKSLLDQAEARLTNAGYNASQTAYGYFNDISMEAKGHPLARIFKEF